LIYIYLCIAAYGLYQCFGLQPFATALTCFGMMGQPYSHDITQGRLLPFPRKHLCSNRTLLAFAAWPLHVAEVGPDVDHPLGGSSDLSYGYCIPYIYICLICILNGSEGVPRVSEPRDIRGHKMCHLSLSAPGCSFFQVANFVSHSIRSSFQVHLMTYDRLQ